MQTPVNHQIEQAPRNANGQLQAGARLNPAGRPVGTGGCLAAIGRVVAEIATSPQFMDALREEARRDPIRYARAVIVPLTPHRFRKELLARIRAAEADTISNESKSQ